MTKLTEADRDLNHLTFVRKFGLVSLLSQRCEGSVRVRFGAPLCCSRSEFRGSQSTSGGGIM